MGHEFIVTFAPPMPIVHVEEDADATARPNGPKRHANDSGLIRSASSIYITKLLEKLVGDPAYAASNDQLRIDGFKTTVSEYCVSTIGIGREHHKVMRLYWGIVTAVKATENVTWLNLGGLGSPSVALRPQDSQQILDELGLNHPRMLRGSSFAFHGHAEWVKGDRMMLRPQNLDRFAVLLPAANPAA